MRALTRFCQGCVRVVYELYQGYTFTRAFSERLLCKNFGLWVSRLCGAYGF